MPKVTSRTESYNPNLESIHMMEGEDQKALLRGSFNPDYPIENQEIRDNYFNSRSQDGDDHDVQEPQRKVSAQ